MDGDSIFFPVVVVAKAFGEPILLGGLFCWRALDMPNNLRDRQNNLLRMGPLWIAAIVSGILTSLAIAAERAPSEEERIAPLVTKQNCWGGVIKYVLQDRQRGRGVEASDRFVAQGAHRHRTCIALFSCYFVHALEREL